MALRAYNASLTNVRAARALEFANMANMFSTTYRVMTPAAKLPINPLSAITPSALLLHSGRGIRPLSNPGLDGALEEGGPCFLPIPDGICLLHRMFWTLGNDSFTCRAL